MIATLRGLNSEAIEDVLKAIISFLLPNPNVRPQELLNGNILELRNKVLDEIVNDFDLDNRGMSTEVRLMVLNKITTELQELLLRDADKRTIRTRLGTNGLLSPSQYEIDYEYFDENIAPFGIRRKHVEDTIRSSDRYRHLELNQAESNKFPRYSIFIKKYSTINLDDPFWHICPVVRLGISLKPVFCWKAYESDVNFEGVIDPLDMLKKFVDTYGTIITIGNEIPSKFHEFIAVPPTYSEQEFWSKLESQFKGDFGMIISKSSITGVLSIAMLYNIDIKKYKGDLQKHGDQVLN